MSWRFLSRDPMTGAVEHYAYDESSDRCIIRRSYDNGPVVEMNKRSQDDDGWTRGKSMRLAARIPIDVQYEWLQKHGVRMWDKNHKEAVRRLLNSNEYQYLRHGKRFII